MAIPEDQYNRDEEWYAYIGGYNEDMPEGGPQNTLEEWYAWLHENIGGSGGSSKLAQVIDRSVTEITAADLAGVTEIGSYAFSSCRSLAEITLPSELTSIGGYAFQYCTSLSEITFPNGITSIDFAMFQGCTSLAEITLPSGLTSIGGSAFSSCTSLAEITLPSGVTSIDAYAFQYCTSLAEITLPSELTSIGGGVFIGCTSLAEIICLPDNPPTISANTFENVPADCAIYVPAASVDAYKAAQYWSDRADYIQAIVE